MKLKSFVTLFLLALFTISFSACNNQPASHEEETEEPQEKSVEDSQLEAWEAALESYHSAMAASFHSAEEDNLEPLKEKYVELGTLSKAWAMLKVPPKYQKENIEEALKDLEKESAAIASVVEEGTDEEMKKAIYDLHDVFHKVQELCYDEH